MTEKIPESWCGTNLLMF